MAASSGLRDAAGARSRLAASGVPIPSPMEAERAAATATLSIHPVT
jgi:hypothetical protein